MYYSSPLVEHRGFPVLWDFGLAMLRDPKPTASLTMMHVMFVVRFCICPRSLAEPPISIITPDCNGYEYFVLCSNVEKS